MRAYLLTILCAATLFSGYASAANFNNSTKTNTGTFAQGDNGDIYNIKVQVGPAAGMTDGSTITVTDTLPSGLNHPVFKSAPAGWSCSVMGRTITCTTTNVIAGGAANAQTIVFTANVSPTAPATVTNSATIAGGGLATVTVSDTDQPITGVPSLTITKKQTSPAYMGTPLPITSGQSVSYRIDVDNQGGAATTGPVTVTDTFASDMIVTSATGGMDWTCTHTMTVVTCTNNVDIPAASGGIDGEIHNINVTASLIGNTANDVATVAGGGSASASTPTVSTSTDSFSSVTITSNTGFVDADGEIYPSPVTLKWDGTLNHTIYGYPNCKISAISGFAIVESQPAAAPYVEVTGQATSSNISETCQ